MLVVDEQTRGVDAQMLVVDEQMLVVGSQILVSNTLNAALPKRCISTSRRI